MPSSLDDATRTFVDALQAPIAPDAPAGEDVTYDDDYLALKDEVDTLSNASDDLDLDFLAEKSLEMLSTKSKDLRVAGYFVVGQTHVDGVVGMAASLAGLRALLEAHWDAMYPPTRRAAARKHALQFVADHLSDWIQRHRFTLEEADAVDLAIAEGTKVQELAMEKLEDQAPALSGFLSDLSRAARRLEQRAHEQAPPSASDADASDDDGSPTDGAGAPSSASAVEPAPRAAPSSRAGDGTAAAGAPSGPRPSGSVQVPEGELSSAEALRIVVQVATALREHDLQDPVPYRLMRTMRWSVLQAAPPHTDGRTQIPAPDDDQRAALNRLAERGAHEKLLTVAEQTFQEGSFHLWLDLQHLAVRAAASLGGGYQAVAEALRHETALLLRRVPALSTLSFRDGTPFANPAVQGWLETIQAEPGDSDVGGSGGDDDRLAAALQEARSALGAGSLDEALDIIDEADHDDSDRSRFRQRLYAARLCLDGGRPEAARPLLEALDADIATYHLDEWEPALAQTVWERLYICYTRLHAPDDGRDFAEAAADVYRRLCRLDVKAALALPPIGDTA